MIERAADRFAKTMTMPSVRGFWSCHIRAGLECLGVFDTS